MLATFFISGFLRKLVKRSNNKGSLSAQDLSKIFSSHAQDRHAGMPLPPSVQALKTLDTSTFPPARIFQKVADHLPALIAYWTLDLRCAFANAAYLEWFGKSSKEMLGIRMHELLGEELYRKNELYIQGALAGHFQEFERTIIKPNGAVGHTWAQYIPDIKNGTVKGFFVLVSDITRLKETEAALLQSKLNERAMEEAKRHVEEASEFKSAFITHLSHEFRTPLAIIKGFAKLLLRSTATPEEKTLWIQRIILSSQQLELLVNDVLDLSKIEAGRLDIDLQKTNLSLLMSEILAMLRYKAEDKNLAFNLALNGLVPAEIVTDQLRLKQVLLNVLDNAIKFTEKGEVDVTLQLLPPQMPNHNTRLVFVIRDSGIGISPDRAAKLFQAFVQADPSITRRFGGTGLGLTLSRHLARMLGGDVILLESEVDKGSVFQITIDAGTTEGVLSLDDLVKNPEAVSISRDVSENRGCSLEGVRILVVDDAPDLRLLVEHILTFHGAVVHAAANGAEAVGMSRVISYDIILMDLQMPILDGYQAVAQMRAAGMRTPMIALTAHAMTGERERCLAAGFTDYLTKPFEPSKLLAITQKLREKEQRMYPTR